MAAKNKPEFLDDARTEHRKESKKFDDAANTSPASEIKTEQPDPADPNKKTDQQTAAPGPAEQETLQGTPPPVRDEFKEAFDEAFKGMEGMIAGDMVVGLIDDLKANFLFIYAKKNGIDLTKEAMLMDPKSKKFAAFCVDFAIKNRFFDTIKKYPLLGAAATILISGGATFVMMQMMKKTNEASKAKDDEIEKLKKEIAKTRTAARATATNVDFEEIKSEQKETEKPEQATEATEILNIVKNDQPDNSVRDFIASA